MMFGPIRHTCSLLVKGCVHTRRLWASPTIFIEDGKMKKQEWYFSGERKKESWKMPPQKEVLPDNEWRSVFHHFYPKGIDRGVVRFLQKGINLRPKAVKSWYKDLKERYTAADQSFNQERVTILGFDLAAAHFLVHRGGKVRFKNTKEWMEQDEDGEYKLSSHYMPNVFVEAIDASRVNLVYEGLGSIKGLRYLKWLSLAGCPNIDDWCIDRICGEYCETLQHLDISNCPKITERGVAALGRLRKLKSLNIAGLDHVHDIKFTCLLLEDTLPSIEISGINYMDLELQQ